MIVDVSGDIQLVEGLGTEECIGGLGPRAVIRDLVEDRIHHLRGSTLAGFPGAHMDTVGDRGEPWQASG